MNARWGREAEFADVKPVTVLRGHEVILYERQQQLGGQLVLAGVIPGKEKMLWLRDYLATQIRK